MQIIMTNKIKHANDSRRQHITENWLDLLGLQWSRQVVITVFHSTWMITKINRVAIDLFCTGVSTTQNIIS